MKKLARYEVTLQDHLQGCAILIAIWFLPSVFILNNYSESIQRRLFSILISAAIFLSAFIALIFLAYLSDRFASSRGRKPELFTAAITAQSFLAGAITGVIAHQMINWPDPDSFSLAMRILHTGFFTAIWVPLTVITLGRLRQLKEKRIALQGEIETLVQIEESASGVLEQIRLTFESSIRNSLKVTALQAQQKLVVAFSSAGEVSPALPELIRDIATIDMRDLSHAMISSELKPKLSTSRNQGERNRLSGMGKTLIATVQDFALRDKLWIIALLMLGSFFQNIIGVLPLKVEIEIIALHGLETIAILALFRTLSLRAPKRIYPLLLLQLFTLIIANNYFISRYRTQISPLIPDGFWDHHFFLIGAVTLFSVLLRLIFLYAINQSKAKYQALAYEAARRKAEHDIHHSEYALLAYKWAKHIHGRVQSQLLATAERLDRARACDDLEAFNLALVEVKNLLTNPDTSPDEYRVSIADEISYRSSLWQGLVEITGTLDEALGQISAAMIRTIGEVFEEAIANAIRHGSATKINYLICHLENGNLRLQITDNGSGITQRSRTAQGLGSQLYARASEANYELKSNEDRAGATLDITLPAR